MKVISIAATCLAAVCLASHLTMAQYQSSPYSQKKMAPTPSSTSSQMGQGAYGMAMNNQQQQSGYESATPAMMNNGAAASQYNDMASGQMMANNYGGSSSSQYGNGKSSSNGGGYGAKSAQSTDGYGKQGYGEQEKPMPYMFGFESDDGYGTTQDRHEVGDARGEVKGSYGYKDPAGIYRQVEYTAGAQGFNAIVKTNEPGVGSTENPADVQYIVETPPEGSYATKSNTAYSSAGSSSADSSNYGAADNSNSYNSNSNSNNAGQQMMLSNAGRSAYKSGSMNNNMAAASQAKSSYGGASSMGSAASMGNYGTSPSSMMMKPTSQMMMSPASSMYGASQNAGKVSGQAMVQMMVNSQKKAALNYGPAAQRAQQSGYGSMMAATPMMMNPSAQAKSSGYEPNRVNMMNSNSMMGSYGATAALMDTDTDTPTYNSQMDSGAQQQQQQDNGATSYDDSAAPAANMMPAMDQAAMSGYGSSSESTGAKGAMLGANGYGDDSANQQSNYGNEQQNPQQFMMSGFETPLQSGKASSGYGSSSASSSYGAQANQMASSGYSSGASGTKSGASNYGQAASAADMMGPAMMMSNNNNNNNNNKYGMQSGSGMMMQGAGKYGAGAMMGGAQKSMAKLRQYQQIPVHPKMMAGGDSSSYGSQSMMAGPMEQSSYGASKANGQQQSYGSNNNGATMMMMSPNGASSYNGAGNNKMALSMIKMLNNNRKSSMAHQQMKMDSQSYGGANTDMSSPAYTKS